MFYHVFTIVLPAAFFICSVVQTYELPGNDERSLANLILKRDPHVQNKDSYMHILSGLLQSNGFIKYASDIPCEIVKKLETSGDEAEDFMKNIVHNKPPTIIKDLPEEIQDAFIKMIQIYHSNGQLDEDQSTADAVADARDLFNDIESTVALSDIKIPGGADSTSAAQSCLLASSLAPTKIYVTSQMATSTVSSKTSSTHTASNGAFIPKVTPSKFPASSSLPITAFSNISRSSSPVPSTIPEAQTANLGNRIAPRPFESTSIGICVVTVLSAFGVALFLTACVSPFHGT